MRGTRSLALAVMAVLIAAPIAQAAQPGPLDPRFTRQSVFFHCPEDPVVTNAGVAAGNPVPSWNTSPPSASVTEGAGCGTLDPWTPVVVEAQENPVDGVWKGTFTGNLDTLTLHFHLMASTTQALSVAAVPALGLRITVDGERVLDTTADPIEVFPNSENLGITEGYDVSVRGLGIIEPNEDVDGDGIGDNPFGTIEHNITVSVDGRAPGVNTLGMWVFDTTEVPAGIDFNPVYLFPPIVDAEPQA